MKPQHSKVPQGLKEYLPAECQRSRAFGSSVCTPEDPCDLCLAQARTKRERSLIADAKPTLTYNPFQALLKK